MKLIAHRANLDGPNKELENNPVQVDKCIELGYDVEVDVRVVGTQIYLGHDKPQYKISLSWLNQRKDNLWIHCKDLNSLEILSNSSIDFNYFWHQTDDYTITSKNFIWTYPEKIVPKNLGVIVVQSALDDKEMETIDCYGLCYDYFVEVNV